MAILDETGDLTLPLQNRLIGLENCRVQAPTLMDFLGMFADLKPFQFVEGVPKVEVHFPDYHSSCLECCWRKPHSDGGLISRCSLKDELGLRHDHACVEGIQANIVWGGTYPDEGMNLAMNTNFGMPGFGLGDKS